jgi:hypothetical protein
MATENPIISLGNQLGQRYLDYFGTVLARRRPQVPGLETSVSFEVMNSKSTGMPSCVF